MLVFRRIRDSVHIITDLGGPNTCGSGTLEKIIVHDISQGMSKNHNPAFFIRG
jgi:hypothetical protein